MFSAVERRKGRQGRKPPPPPLKLAPQSMASSDGPKFTNDNGNARKEVDKIARYSVFAPLEASPNINLQLRLPIYSPWQGRPSPDTNLSFFCPTGSSTLFSPALSFCSTEATVSRDAYDEASVGHAAGVQLTTPHGGGGLAANGSVVLEPEFHYAFRLQGAVDKGDGHFVNRELSLKTATVSPICVPPLRTEFNFSPRVAGCRMSGSSGWTGETAASQDNDSPCRRCASPPPQSPRDLQTREMPTASPLNQNPICSSEHVNLPSRPPSRPPTKNDSSLDLAERIMQRALTRKEQAALLKALGRRPLAPAPG
ncbi:hypothetical protein ACJZ2D_015841 [Fusarium nematophilum]